MLIFSKIKIKTLLCAAFYVFIVLPLMPLVPLWAQSFDLPKDADLFAPIIQHHVLEKQIVAGDSFQLKARVRDNLGVTEVILYYRIPGEKSYSSINMEAQGDGHYEVLLSGDEIVAPGIEYYIQAKDLAGNTSQRAFPFSPLLVKVLNPEAATLNFKKDLAKLSQPTQNETSGKILTNKLLPPEKTNFVLSTEQALTPKSLSSQKPLYKKWWVWAIVVAIAGGAAAASSGGGGSSAAAPAAGSLDVSGPLP